MVNRRRTTSILTESTTPYRIAKTENNLSDVEGSPRQRNIRERGVDYDSDDDEDGYVDYRNKLREQTEKRVRAIDANQGRCLVENCAEHAGVIFCYCYPLHALENDPRLMDSLEWFWKMGYYSLNFESSRNVFRVGAAIRQLYEKHYWLLLPEESIVNEYHSVLREVNGTWSAHRETFPIIPDRSDFEYRFIPISDRLRHIAISHQLNHPGDEPLTPNDFSISVYPFSDIPSLKSHVHPRYAILEAGRKLTKRVSSRKLQELLVEYPLLTKVVQIYGAWTAKRPDDAMDDATYYTLRYARDVEETST